jgi:NitT/TauT family transport system ATP-binding protein
MAGRKTRRRADPSGSEAGRVDSLRENWLGDRVGSDLVPSLRRFTLGFLVGATTGVVAGTMIGLSPRLRQVTQPVARERARGRSAPQGVRLRPDAAVAIEEISLATSPGELLCVVGPSGCGKTTLLRCVAGLTPPTSGEVRLDGEVVTAPPPSMTLVFQDYSRSLLPWMTVDANVGLPLKRRPIPKRARRERADEALRSVGLAGHGNRYPWQLSAGMRQRVAIAPALAYRPRLLLLDEPFASLDAQTRADLQDLLLDISDRSGLTAPFVTHDIDEAVHLGDRVVVLAASPTRVEDTFTVDLPRPRDQLATKALPPVRRAAGADLRLGPGASTERPRPTLIVMSCHPPRRTPFCTSRAV